MKEVAQGYIGVTGDGVRGLLYMEWPGKSFLRR